MLENSKKVRKIIIVLIAIVAILGIYIGIRKIPKEAIEKKMIPAEQLELARTSNTIETIELEGVTITPTYRPKWTKTKSVIDTTNKTLTITVEGSAKETNTINDDIKINYDSKVTSTLEAKDITVYINGTNVTSITNPDVKKYTNLDVQIQQPEGKEDVTDVEKATHEIVLSNFEEAIKQAGVKYKNWSGNVQIRIAGRGEAESTYTEKVLYDEYSNQSMMATQDDATGTWIDVTYKEADSTTNANDPTSENTMFVDFVKPQFNYIYAGTSKDAGNTNPEINYGTKKLTVVFSVTDKYFDDSKTAEEYLTTSNLSILVDGETPTGASVNFIDYSNIEEDSKTVGYMYTLEISNLQQNPNNAFDYSGIVTIAIPSGTFADLSGNKNDGQTITVGMDLPDDLPYIPEGYHYVEGNASTGIVIADTKGNEYVWVEVPKSIYSSKTMIIDFNQLETNVTSAANGSDEKTAAEAALTAAYKAIEDDMKTYATIYRGGSVADEPISETDGEEDYSYMTKENYTLLKRKMLKSVFKNGGFYVGRYETGIDDDSTQAPVIKKNAYPYTHVTVAQAQKLASEDLKLANGYQTSLLFGIQWDLVLRHIEKKEVEHGVAGDNIRSELITNSTSWGNYSQNTYTTDAESKYNISTWNDDSSNAYTLLGWADGEYKKESTDIGVLLSTGASDKFKKQNIYDLAGNIFEWTLEKHFTEAEIFLVKRGDTFNNRTYTGNARSRKLEYLGAGQR